MIKELTYNQCINLIYFTFIVKSDNNGYTKQSPDYIMEKFEKYVDIDPNRLDHNEHLYNMDERLVNYCNAWKIKDIDTINIYLKNIIMYLSHCGNGNTYPRSVEDMIEVYNQYLGEICDVKDEYLIPSGIHFKLIEWIEKWLDLPLNRDYMNILRRDGVLDDLLK